jgi:hypothetical protein
MTMVVRLTQAFFHRSNRTAIVCMRFTRRLDSPKVMVCSISAMLGFAWVRASQLSVIFQRTMIEPGVDDVDQLNCKFLFRFFTAFRVHLIVLSLFIRNKTLIDDQEVNISKEIFVLDFGDENKL